MLLTRNTHSFTLKRNFLCNFAGLRVASEDKLYLLPEVLDVRSSALCHRHAHYLRHTGRGRLKHDCKRLPLRLAAGLDLPARQRRGRGRHVGRFCRRALSRYCRHTGRVLRPADDRCLGSGMDGHKKLEGTGRRPGVSGGSARSFLKQPCCRSPTRC